MIYRWQIIFTILFAGSVWSQEKWELQDIWHVLAKNNLSLAQQENFKKQIETEIDRSRTLLLPELSASAFYRYQSELARLELPFPGIGTIEAGTHTQYDAALTITQPVFTGFHNTNRIRSTEAQYRVQEDVHHILQQRLMLQSGLLFYDIQQNLLQQRTLSASLRRADNQLTKMKNMRVAGQVTAFDTLETANRKLEIVNNLSATQDLLGILRARLSTLLHVDYIPDLLPVDLNISKFSMRELQEWQQLALKRQPELQKIKHYQELQNHESDVRRSAYYPQIYANFSYHYARPGVNFFVDEWMDYYSVGIQLQWNLWNWKRDSYSVQRSILEQQRLDLSLKESEFSVKNEIRQLYLMVQTAATQIQLQQQFVGQESERYRLTKERFAQGMTTALDLNSSEESLTTAELSLQQQIINWYKAKMQLAFAAGDFISAGNDDQIGENSDISPRNHQ
jgi:outer membrane protein TolC